MGAECVAVDGQSTRSACAALAIAQMTTSLAAMGPTAAATLLVDADGSIGYRTPACDEFWPADVGGTVLSDLFEGESLAELERAVADGVTWHGRLEVAVAEPTVVSVKTARLDTELATDSGVRWVQLTREEPRPNLPVDERERVEASLERGEALLDAMPDLLFRISSDMTFLDYRDPTMKGLGLSPEEFMGKRLDEFLPPELCELIEPNLRIALETDETVMYTSMYDYEDGTHTFENRVVKSGPDEVVLICRDTTVQTRAVAAARRERTRLQRIVESSREFTTISDAENRLTFVSPSVERVLGISAEWLVGRDAFCRVHPEDLAGPGSSDFDEGGVGRLRLLHADGTWRTFEISIMPLFDDPDIEGLLTHCRDVSDYVAIQSDLLASLDRIHSIVETAAEGIVTTDGDGVIDSANSAAAEMFERDKAELIGMSIHELMASGARPRTRAIFERALADGSAAIGQLSLEIMGVRPSGVEFPVALSVSTPETAHGDVVTLIISDMSDRAAFEHQLQYQASHDILTGLPNRTLFDQDVDRALRHQDPDAADGFTVGVLFIDLDRFKVVNDSLGHIGGDHLLREVANRLVVAIRGDGTVARFGATSSSSCAPAWPPLRRPRSSRTGS